LDLAFQQDAQLFVTTHDEEWLKSLIEVIEDSQIDEVSLWRFQRNDRGESELKQFSGSVLKAAIETGREVR
jgi:AAA15 family ATPase/GTPase